MLRPADPAAADLHIGTFDRGPGDAVRRFLLTRVAGVGREGMVEGLAVDVLGMRRQMPLHRDRKVAVAPVRHDRPAVSTRIPPAE
jgi:hypothetical protein